MAPSEHDPYAPYPTTEPDAETALEADPEDLRSRIVAFYAGRNLTPTPEQAEEWATMDSESLADALADLYDLTDDDVEQLRADQLEDVTGDLDVGEPPAKASDISAWLVEDGIDTSVLAARARVVLAHEEALSPPKQRTSVLDAARKALGSSADDGSHAAGDAATEAAVDTIHG
jgi:hypothetical protein